MCVERARRLFGHQLLNALCLCALINAAGRRRVGRRALRRRVRWWWLRERCARRRQWGRWVGSLRGRVAWPPKRLRLPALLRLWAPAPLPVLLWLLRLLLLLLLLLWLRLLLLLLLLTALATLLRCLCGAGCCW